MTNIIIIIIIIIEYNNNNNNNYYYYYIYDGPCDFGRGRMIIIMYLVLTVLLFTTHPIHGFEDCQI